MDTPRSVVLKAIAARSRAACDALPALAAEANRSTENGYDRSWVDAINGVLEDREEDGRASLTRIDDLNDALWESYIAPMIDSIERGEWPELDADRPRA